MRFEFRSDNGAFVDAQRFDDPPVNAIKQATATAQKIADGRDIPIHLVHEGKTIVVVSPDSPEHTAPNDPAPAPKKGKTK